MENPLLSPSGSLLEPLRTHSEEFTEYQKRPQELTQNPSPVDSSSEGSLTHLEEPSRSKSISFKNLEGSEPWKRHSLIVTESSPEMPQSTYPLEYSTASPPIQPASTPVTPRQSRRGLCTDHDPSRNSSTFSSPLPPPRSSREFKSRVTPRPRRQAINMQNLFDADNLNFPLTDFTLLTVPKIELITPSTVEIPQVRTIDDVDDADLIIESQDEPGEVEDSVYIDSHNVRELLERKRYKHPSYSLETILRKESRIRQNRTTYQDQTEYFRWEQLSHLAGWHASPQHTPLPRRKGPKRSVVTLNPEYSSAKKIKRKGRPPNSSLHVQRPKVTTVDWFGYEPHPVLRDLRWCLETRPAELDPLTLRPRLVLYLRKRPSTDMF